MDKQEARDYIEARITRKDCLAWHDGELTTHVESLMKQADVTEIHVCPCGRTMQDQVPQPLWEYCEDQAYLASSSLADVYYCSHCGTYDYSIDNG